MLWIMDMLVGIFCMHAASWIMGMLMGLRPLPPAPSGDGPVEHCAAARSSGRPQAVVYGLGARRGCCGHGCGAGSLVFACGTLAVVIGYELHPRRRDLRVHHAAEHARGPEEDVVSSRVV